MLNCTKPSKLFALNLIKTNLVHKAQFQCKNRAHLCKKIIIIKLQSIMKFYDLNLILFCEKRYRLCIFIQTVRSVSNLLRFRQLMWLHSVANSFHTDPLITTSVDRYDDFGQTHQCDTVSSSLKTL